MTIGGFLVFSSDPCTERSKVALCPEMLNSRGNVEMKGYPDYFCDDMDLSVEIYYPKVLETILETGYRGYVGQEFIPLRDPVISLAQAAKMCDV